jgi:hypothetical protein
VSTLKPRRTAASTDFRALRGDPDRRVRLLHRLREHGRLGNLEELPVVAERLTGEGLQDDVDRLLPARAAALQIETEALELVGLIAAPEAGIDAPAGQEIQRRSLLGDHQGMVERHHDDAVPTRIRVVRAAM